jgi:hypothetical protein
MQKQLNEAYSHFYNEKQKLENRMKLLESPTLKAQKVLVGEILSFVSSLLFDLKTVEKSNIKDVSKKYIEKDEEFIRLGIECQNHNFYFQAEFYREISKYSGRARLYFSDFL